jgi:hypothetical protein
MYDDEVELAPGIYLTKRSTPTVPNDMQEELKKKMEYLEANPKEYIEYLKAEIKRVDGILVKLEYSNKEMLMADPTDKIFIESIAENKVIIQRNQVYVQEMKMKLNKIATSLGICLQQEYLIQESKDIVVEQVDQGYYL